MTGAGPPHVRSEPHTPRAGIIGIGLATPPHRIDQSQAARFALDTSVADPDQRKLVEGLFARSGVASRASAILSSMRPSDQPPDQSLYTALADDADGAWPRTAARMECFHRHAGVLAIDAARRALAEAGVAPAAITHLITVSCTGMEAPGVDVQLMQALGLDAGVQRLNLGFMGCHGGIVAVRAAAALVESSRAASHARPPRVLAVCVELCSLHFQRTDRGDQHVANALFADGAAAMVVTDRSFAPAPHALGIRAASSRLFPASTGAMGWRIGDHGFEMTLDRSVPSLLETHLHEWIWPWLRSELGADVAPADIHWCVHPGGPRVLDAVQRGLGLDDAALRHSRDVLREHGNMSSATVLFILHRMRSQPAPEPPAGRPVVMLAFGPGLTGEAALLMS